MNNFSVGHASVYTEHVTTWNSIRNATSNLRSKPNSKYVVMSATCSLIIFLTIFYRPQAVMWSKESRPVQWIESMLGWEEK